MTYQAIKMTDDGLGVTRGTVDVQVVNHGGLVLLNSYHFKRENKDYLLYTYSTDASGNLPLMIASSENGVLGPYYDNRDIVIGGEYDNPTVVKDVDDVSDVLIYGVYYGWAIGAVNLEWKDGKPHVNTTARIIEV